MQLTDVDNLDPVYKTIVVLFNASPEMITIGDDSFKELKFELHPIQAASVDETVRKSDFDTANGRFTILGRTTAVFVLRD